MNIQLFLIHMSSPFFLHMVSSCELFHLEEEKLGATVEDSVNLGMISSMQFDFDSFYS